MCQLVALNGMKIPLVTSINIPVAYIRKGVRNTTRNLLGITNAYLPIWSRKTETSDRMLQGEIKAVLKHSPK